MGTPPLETSQASGGCQISARLPRAFMGQPVGWMSTFVSSLDSVRDSSGTAGKWRSARVTLGMGKSKVENTGDRGETGVEGGLYCQ